MPVKGYVRKEDYWISPRDNMYMVLIEKGCFFMGDKSKYSYKDERPIHEVYLDNFLIDLHKINRETYSLFLKEIKKLGGHHPKWCHPEEPLNKSHVPLHWEKQLKNPMQPVTGVDWYDAWAYSRWIGKSLPTEAQWEKACKLYNNILKMSDNGWEWCLDGYNKDFYKNSKRYEPCYLKACKYKVVRGGLSNNTLPLPRPSFRNKYSPLHRDEYLGFRCVKKIANI